MRAGQRAGGKIHSSLKLRREEYTAMCSARQPRFIGSGQIGAVYDVDYNGTRCACKKFFESVCSAKAFEREAVLLADLRRARPRCEYLTLETLPPPEGLGATQAPV